MIWSEIEFAERAGTHREEFCIVIMKEQNNYVINDEGDKAWIK